jgi:Zn-dependent protease
MNLSTMQMIAVWAIPVVFAITLHEASHGWMASKLGDKTAQMLGRLTLNPLKHIDLFGTIIIPLSLLLMGGKVIFGWAKPVPINPQNLKHPRRDLALISIIGPFSNLLMAIIWAMVMKVGLLLNHNAATNIPLFLKLTGEAGIMINLILGVLNLIPIPPLDGGHFVSNLLPKRVAYYYDRVERYGFVIILILVLTRVLNVLLIPPVYFLHNLLNMIFKLY